LIADELYTVIKNVCDADTSGGLSDSSSSSYVRSFFRMGDPNDRSQNWPIIRVEIIENEADSFGKDSVRAVVRFHVYTNSYNGFATQGAILNRLRTLYHRVDLAASASWTYNWLSFRNGTQAQTTENELHYVIPAQVVARKV